MQKKDNLVRILATAFGLSVLIYVVCFSGMQYLREHKGGWHVEFRTDAENHPSVVVSQPALGIVNQTFSFPEQTGPRANYTRTIVFDGPLTNAPFGEVIFQDPTFLPGTLTFNFWGHELEFMPRTMVVNFEEIAWHTRTNLVLTGQGKHVVRPPAKRRIIM